MKDDKGINNNNNDDENTILKIKSDGSDECILIFKENVSEETVINALMTALYSISIGLEGNNYDFAIHAAEEYLSFVRRKIIKGKSSKGKASKPTLKLLSPTVTRHSEQATIYISGAC